MSSWRVTIFSLAILLWGVGSSQAIDFDRQIRPLLSDRCFQCHGPDEQQRQADLRLDTPAFLENSSVLVAGDATHSEIYRRLTAEDPDERMPPPETKLSVSPAEIEAVKQWIDEGARWQEHWAFVRPQRPRLPEQADEAEARGAVDSFVLQKLQEAGLPVAEQADRRTLIRRLTLDLTGLPPTPAEVAAFLADSSPAAYRRLVDRLLASPRYGERMANSWLDAARFADTSGYQNDGPRSMWRWRDWVIEAYNAGLPFDQFTVEQLAGDLLPNATLDQRIATGFNRNHRGNSEGGIIPEEYQVEYVVDRVETTATVWLALTMGCARCHDHKFDPFTQTEFYRMFAFFNNIPESGRAVKEGNSPPYIAAPTEIQHERLAHLEHELAVAREAFDSVADAREDALTRTLENLPPAPDQPTISADLVTRFSYDAVPGGSGQLLDAPTVVGGPVERVTGRVGQGLRLDGQRAQEVEGVATFGYRDRFTLMAWVFPESDSGTLISKMVDEPEGAGYSMGLVDGRVAVNLVVRWLDDAVRVSTTERVAANRWTHVAVTYDGSRSAKGIQVYLDGEATSLEVHLDGINQTFAKGNEPLRIGAGGGPSSRFRGVLDDVRVYARCLSAQEVWITSETASVAELRELPSSQWSARQASKLRHHFLLHLARGKHRALYQRRVSRESEYNEFLERLPTVMVMEEMDPPRETFVLGRGQYDNPGERVTAGMPERLPNMEGQARNRLDFAQWLVAAENPLTARVAVNRYWQQLFGEGLVRTTEDFGSQGERPTHPALLDWLAVEFREQGWDGKRLQRELVSSATYRRASALTGESYAGDPENRLLGRGPRYRLPAQTVRDQALAASGLLVQRVGGPSVKPYQPADLWRDIATTSNYEQSQGAGLYRRSLYTYWKRTVSPPSMVAFDASTREMCRVRVARTNTPLQALTLLNDVTFVEASRELAALAIAEREDVADRLQLVFERVLARPPSAGELRVLHGSLSEHLAHYGNHLAEAQQLVRSGESSPPTDIDPTELAAYTAVASTVLNLDEAVTKQ